jgi:hypothetical protein
MGLLDIIFPSLRGCNSRLDLKPKPYEGPPSKCENCGSDDINLDQSFDLDNIRTENYFCNQCGHKGGYSIV